MAEEYPKREKMGKNDPPSAESYNLYVDDLEKIYDAKTMIGF
jgi:hypothetical protein